MSDPSPVPEGDIPDDVAAWIDEHDVDLDPSSVDEVLAEQRATHDADDASTGSGPPPPGAPPVADVVNNVGDDGGAASG